MRNTKLMYFMNPVKQNASIIKKPDFLGTVVQMREHPPKKVCIGFLYICVKF